MCRLITPECKILCNCLVDFHLDFTFPVFLGRTSMNHNHANIKKDNKESRKYEFTDFSLIFELVVCKIIDRRAFEGFKCILSAFIRPILKTSADCSCNIDCIKVTWVSVVVDRYGRVLVHRHQVLPKPVFFQQLIVALIISWSFKRIVYAFLNLKWI